MSIEEQIKIARLIASGTPREVAITESRVMDKKSIVKSGPTIDVKATDMGSEMTAQDKAKSRLDKVRQAGRIARKKIQRGVSKGGAIVKSAAGKLTKKDNKLKPKSSADMNKPDDKPTTNVNVVLPKDKQQLGIEKIDSAEGGATATQKAAGNLGKVGFAATKKTAKVAGGALKLGFKGAKKLMRKEEFIQEVEDKKDSKTKKVIDIMRGKNSIKINPDVKENTVVVQDASGKDFVEIVDIITPQKVRSDWRKEINVTEASAAWQRKEGKSKSGGLNEKGRKSYERQNPGSDLKAPSKKVGNKRRASFCARMKGMKKKLTSAKTARDPNSRINKSLRAWNC
jgi:hypothetical protein